MQAPHALHPTPWCSRPEGARLRTFELAFVCHRKQEVLVEPRQIDGSLLALLPCRAAAGGGRV